MKASPFAKRPAADTQDNKDLPREGHGEIRVVHVCPEHKDVMGLQGYAVTIAGYGERQLCGDPFYDKKKNVNYMNSIRQKDGVAWSFVTPHELNGKGYGKRWIVFFLLDHDRFLTQQEIMDKIQQDIIPLWRSQYRFKDYEQPKFPLYWYRPMKTWNDFLHDTENTEIEKLVKNGCCKMEPAPLAGAKTVEEFMKVDRTFIYSMWPVGQVPIDAFYSYGLDEEHVEKVDWDRWEEHKQTQSKKVEPVPDETETKTDDSTAASSNAPAVVVSTVDSDDSTDGENEDTKKKSVNKSTPVTTIEIKIEKDTASNNKQSKKATPKKKDTKSKKRASASDSTNGSSTTKPKRQRTSKATKTTT